MIPVRKRKDITFEAKSIDINPDAKGLFLFVTWVRSYSISRMSFKMYMLDAQNENATNTMHVFKSCSIFVNWPPKNNGRKIKRFLMY